MATGYKLPHPYPLEKPGPAPTLLEGRYVAFLTNRDPASWKALIDQANIEPLREIERVCNDLRVTRHIFRYLGIPGAFQDGPDRFYLIENPRCPMVPPYRQPAIHPFVPSYEIDLGYHYFSDKNVIIGPLSLKPRFHVPDLTMLHLAPILRIPAGPALMHGSFGDLPDYMVNTPELHVRLPPMRLEPPRGGLPLPPAMPAQHMAPSALREYLGAPLRLPPAPPNAPVAPPDAMNQPNNNGERLFDDHEPNSTEPPSKKAKVEPEVKEDEGGEGEVLRR